MDGNRDPIEIARDRMFNGLLVSVWIILVFYSFLHGFLGAKLSTASVLIGVVILSPLAWLLNSGGFKHQARLFFLFSCYFYIYSSSLGFGHKVFTEYYYLPGAIVCFLMFGREHRKSLAVGVLVPVLLWSFTLAFGYSFVPSDWVKHDIPHELVKNFNFLGSFGVGLFFLIMFLKINNQLKDMLIKRKEEEVKLTLALKAKENELGAILKNSRNEIYIFDSKTFLHLEVNQAALDNLGHSYDELKALHPWDLKPRISEKRYRKIVECLIKKEREKVEFSTIHKRKDGTTYPVEVHLQLASFSGESVIIAMVLDRTENEKMQQDLLHASRLSSIGELAAGVGHEVNNPLAIAMGYNEKLVRILKKELNLDEDKQVLFNKIQTAHKRIQNIVNGLRVYARSHLDESETFSASAAIKQTLELLGELYSKQNIKIETAGLESNYIVRGSMGGLQQVFTNLLSNAKDAMANSDHRVVSISLVEERGKLILSVEDNGEGILESDQAKVFDSFYTTKAVGQGTGLGLSLSSKICKDMGGRIYFESVQNKGTTFYVELPLEKNEVELSEDQLPEQMVQQKAIKILVVEDEENIREIIQDELEELGHLVMTAENGEKALAILDENPFDLVFSDLQMPVMSGVDFMRKVHEAFGKDRPKIVALTGGVSSEFSTEGNRNLKELIDDLITKPFNENDLAKVIDSLFSY
jgi:PAS domain S-box-containing protein